MLTVMPLIVIHMLCCVFFMNMKENIYELKIQKEKERIKALTKKRIIVAFDPNSNSLMNNSHSYNVAVNKK